MEVPKCSKIVEFPKIFIKMKNCKTFYEAQTASHLKEIIQLSPNLPAPDKILLLLWNKNFLTEIYRNIQTFAFKVLQECSSWASRNGAVQIFFLTPNRKMLARKFVKSETFLAMLREHIIFSVNWVEFRKKALRYSARKSEIKKKLMMSTGTSDQI